jgi:hypothetical protein
MHDLIQPRDPIGLAPAAAMTESDLVPGQPEIRRSQRRITTAAAILLACAISGGVLYAAQPKPYPDHMTTWAFRV